MQERDAFSLKLEDTENWLYEDGEDQQKQVYIDKLADLKVMASPELFRVAELIPSVTNRVAKGRTISGKFPESFR